MTRFREDLQVQVKNLFNMEKAHLLLADDQHLLHDSLRQIQSRSNMAMQGWIATITIARWERDNFFETDNNDSIYSLRS